MKRLFVVALVLCISLFAMDASAKRTTRDLVFEDETPAAAAPSAENAEQTLAVKTTILLTRAGQVSTVAPSTEFKTGDSVKFVFTPNIDGYVYWLAKGSSGNHTLLFPTPKSGMDNAVKRNEEYTIPVKGSFKFDDKVGKEELLCILSAEKMPDMEKLVAEAAAGKVSDEINTAVASLDQQNTSKRATRDLVFEDEDTADVNTKSQQASKGTPMIAHYILTHN